MRKPIFISILLNSILCPALFDENSKLDKPSDPEHQFELGLYLVKENYCLQGLKYIMLSAERNHIDAQIYIGRVEFGCKNYEKAMKWFILAAKKNHPEAQFYIGKIYLLALENYHKAKEWFMLAAKQNHPKAQVYVAYFYIEESQALGDKEAIKWFLLAALQNEPESQLAIGVMYLYGYGVDIDYEEALKLFFRVANRIDIKKRYLKDANSGIEKVYKKTKKQTGSTFFEN